jgi:hypothetical protein
MAVISKGILSGSTNGRPFRVLGATTSGGTLVHTAITATGTNNGDEVWIWASNTGTTTCQLVLRHGGTSSSDEMKFSVPASDGYYLVSPGLLLNGGLIVRAHSSASNQINVVGYINGTATV